MGIVGAHEARIAQADIDVVICTHNRAPHLDEALRRLSCQPSSPGVAWSVLVVDNASSDETPFVVEEHRRLGVLPGLRRVFEESPGLTAARRRGVRATRAPWIAFVDDDNMLEPGWLAAVADVIRAQPHAGGVGGRVVLDWECAPPEFMEGFGFCFAEQDAGGAPREVNSLAGAGMVVRRSALVECGWVERPLLADRVGKRLVSGGDVEIVQRIRALGYPLWFTPYAVLRHRIPKSRATWRYLLRVNHGLGGSEALVSALTWPGDWASWQDAARRRRSERLRKAAKGLAYALRRRRGLVPAMAWFCFAIGFARGVRACRAMDEGERRALLGAAVARTRDG